MSELETLLRSWTPRRPSPGVKHRVFGRGSEPEGEDSLAVDGSGAVVLQPAPFRLGWFAPATVSLLLACVLFNHHNSFVLSDSTGGPLVAAALSNQSAAAWLPGSFERSQNSLPVDAFDWTNVSRRGSFSGVGGAN